MVVCIHIPRFALSVAAGGRSKIGQQTLAGRPLALAPTVGGALCIGEVSGTAEAYGIEAGMAVGEALARCPELELIAADPLAVAEAWEGILRALEAIGAAVEPAEREGIVYFGADGLRGLHGSHEGTIAAARHALDAPARIGAGPTRFCAMAAAVAASVRRAKILNAHNAHDELAGMPIDLLARRRQTAALVAPLRRLGVLTLGELRRLGAAALADRFGDPGILAYALAAGTDTPLVPRKPEEVLSESLEVGDASSGAMLECVLGVLVDRLIARPQRRGRALRTVVLSASLEEGGTWRERVVFREAIGDGERICLGLLPRLGLLPAPAVQLRLEVERYGPLAGEQGSLLDQRAGARRERLGEAVAQVRSLAGHEAALRAVCIDPDSRVPERRVVLAPLP